MPYSGPDDSKLPANVQKMPEKDRERWVAIFNSTYEDCDGDSEACEGKAFRIANGTVKDVVDGIDKGLWSLFVDFLKDRVVRPDTDDKAVAHIAGRNHVHRHHAGTLHSHLHIHNDEDTDHDVHPQVEEAKQRENSFEIFKDINGNWRWLAIVSNNFKDREDEIIEEAAHLEYVAYADETKDYGEAWLWHTPGTAWGDADFVEYVDGFLLKSGTVRPGFEDVAEALSHDTNLGVSHGFYSQYGDKGIISWYRDFEVSPLPLEVAANPWTGLSVLKKEAEMGLSAKKRAWLEEKWGKERVDALGNDIKALGDALVAANIDYKDMPLDDEPSTDDNADNQDKSVISAQTITDAVTKAIDESQRFKALDESIASIKANADQVPDILARLTELEKSDDDKLMDYMQAKSRNINGYRASQSDGTVLNPDNAVDKALQTAKPGYMVDEGFTKSLGVGG